MGLFLTSIMIIVTTFIHKETTKQMEYKAIPFDVFVKEPCIFAHLFLYKYLYKRYCVSLYPWMNTIHTHIGLQWARVIQWINSWNNSAGE